MSLKGKITGIINTEARKVMNEYYALYNTKAQANSGAGRVVVDKYDSRTGLMSVKKQDGTIVNDVNPGSSPIGPGTVAMLIGGVLFY